MNVKELILELNKYDESKEILIANPKEKINGVGRIESVDYIRDHPNAVIIQTFTQSVVFSCDENQKIIKT